MAEGSRTPETPETAASGTAATAPAKRRGAAENPAAAVGQPPAAGAQPPAEGPAGGSPPADTGFDEAAYQARIAALEQELALVRAATVVQAGPSGGAAGGPAYAPPSEPRPPRSGRWRPWVVAVLLVIAVPLAISTVVARWAHNEVGNTDRYVATMETLASDPAVQAEVVDKVTNAIFTRFDVQAVTEEAIDALAGQGLPPRAVQTLDALTVPLVNGIQSFVRDQVTTLIESERFQEAWVTANAEAHTQLIAVLTGEGSDTISVDGGTVTLNLAPIIERVKAELIARGFGLAERIPAVNATFTILESEELGTARTVFAALESSAVILPFLLLLVLGLAVLLARDRRRTLLIAALTVTGSMLLLGAILNFVRPVYLNNVPPEILGTEAAAAIYDTLMHYLRLALRLVAAVMLVIAFIAWIVGPSAPARGIRSLTARGARAIGGAGSTAGSTAVAGVNTGAAGTFAKQHVVMLRVGVVAVALLLFAVVDGPSTAYVITLLVIAVVAWLAVEFLARTAPVAGAIAVDAGTPTSATAITEPVPAPVAPSEDTAVTAGATTATGRTIELDTGASRESAGHGTSGG